MILFRYSYPIQSKMVMSDITCTTCPSLTIPFDRLNRYRKYNLSSSHWWACQKSISVFRGCNIRYIFQEYSVSKFYLELQPQSLRSSWSQFLNSKTIPSMSSTKKIAVFGGEPESEFNRIDLKSHYYGKPSKPVITPIVLGQWFCGKLQVINGSNHHTWSLGGQKGEKKWLNDKLNCESNHLGLYKTISHGPEPNREPDYYQKRTIIGAREPKLNNGENKCDCTRKIQCNGVSFTSALLPVAPKSRFLSRIRSEFFYQGRI